MLRRRGRVGVETKGHIRPGARFVKMHVSLVEIGSASSLRLTPKDPTRPESRMGTLLTVIVRFAVSRSNSIGLCSLASGR